MKISRTLFFSPSFWVPRRFLVKHPFLPKTFLPQTNHLGNCIFLLKHAREKTTKNNKLWLTVIKRNISDLVLYSARILLKALVLKSNYIEQACCSFIVTGSVCVRMCVCAVYIFVKALNMINSTRYSKRQKMKLLYPLRLGLITVKGEFLSPAPKRHK